MRKFFPLTNAQKSIWQIVKFDPNTSFVNLAATIRIRESVQYHLLNKAINIAIENNDAMRMRIVENRKEPKQYFAEHREQQFEFLDFSYPNGMEDLHRWEEARIREKIELLECDLFNFTLINISDHEGAFFFKCHHIAADAWSLTLLVSQILRNYRKLRDHEEVIPEELPSYKARILSEYELYSSEKSEKHKLFWNELFSTVPEFTAFNNRRVFKNTSAARTTNVFSRDLTLQIKEFGSVHKVSPFCILISTLAICIWRMTFKTDMVVGTPILNRIGVREKNTMGMFISNIPFRLGLNPDRDFISLVLSVGQEWNTVLKHQRYPFDHILKTFRETHGINNKLIDIALSFQNAVFEVHGIEYSAEWLFNGSELNSLSIHVNDREGSGHYILDYQHLTEVFSEDDISRIHQYLVTLLSNSLANPSSKVSDIKMLSPEQEHDLVWKFNNTKQPYPLEETVVSLFQRQVNATPNKVAVIFEKREVTYQELNDRSNQLARFLRSKGVQKDSIVGLTVDRSLEMIIAIFAVLKASGAYLPIDPTYPAERIDFMLKQSNCQVLLTYTINKNFDFAFDGSICNLRELELYQYSAANLEDGPFPEDLAYVIFTSGSTGTPKGVMVEHKSLNNLIHYLSNTFQRCEKTVLSISSVSFDIFFVETIFPLVTGMRVILANQQEATVSYLLLNLITAYKVDFLQTTPSRMKAILSDSQAFKLNILSEIILAGESFPQHLLSELTKLTNAKIFNGYGPTETTVFSTVKLLEPNLPVTIGTPLANTQIYIMDENLKLVPIGVPGEIFISGDGLARGYINNEGLTKERFIPNPFIPGSLMYKAGDLAKWLSNGEIECIGRNDHQVKIRGIRIELGEIENCLLKHDLIKEAAVICREDKAQRKYLCAYLSVNGEVSIQDLRDYLSHSLPDYMVPPYFVFLNSLPLTPNGKIDRQALPEPERIREDKRKYSAPRNPMEERLVELWEETLEVAGIGIDDNFFELGGDSLAVIEILSGLYPDSLRLSAQDFYDYPTIRRLSAKISGAVPESDSSNAKLVLSLQAVPALKQTKMDAGGILLTGATGFLGIHILAELLSDASEKIYCLVRGQNPEKKLYQLLRFYFPNLSTSLLKNRLVVITGDVAKQNCGLAKSEYVRLAQDVSTVIHAAALVKHYGPYEEFHAINVGGTQELINFCLNYAKKLYHISTVSVAGMDPANKRTSSAVKDNDLFNKNYQGNVYIRSKIEAENLIAAASAAGLDAAVFRVGLLTGRYLDGQFQKNIGENAFYRMLKSVVMLEALPVDLLQGELEFTPVDFCAKAIVGIVQANSTKPAVFHLFNHKTIKLMDAIKVFERAGISIESLSRKSFDSLLSSISTTDWGREILSGIISDPSLKAAFGSSANGPVDSSLSLKFLQQIGFEWPDITEEYLLKVLDYMQNTGFVNKSLTGKRS